MSPGLGSYRTASGDLQIYDATMVLAPAWVVVRFVTGTSGRIIHAEWVGTTTEKFDPATHPPPAGAGVPDGKVVNAYLDNHGGNWTERLPEELADRVSPENIIEKMKQK